VLKRGKGSFDKMRCDDAVFFAWVVLYRHMVEHFVMCPYSSYRFRQKLPPSLRQLRLSAFHRARRKAPFEQPRTDGFSTMAT